MAPHVPRFVDIYWPAPLTVYTQRLRADACGHLTHALAEVAVDAHDDLFARFEQIDQRCFHAGATRARHWEGQTVVGFENISQECLHVIHRAHEERIEVAKQ